MSLKLSAIPATAVALAPTDLLYLAKDMGGSFLEHKLPGSVLDAKYVPQTRAINTTAPLIGGGDLSADRTFSMPAATGAVDGYLTAANFTIFNNKGDAQTSGTLAQFANTSSAQFAGVISDETGFSVGALLVFNINPTLAGATFSAALNLGSNLINNVANPVAAQDAATKAYVDAIATPPFLDTNALIKGSVDATKLLRFEVDGFTAATTRVLTPPNANATIAGLEVAQTFTQSQTMAANLLFSPDNTVDIGATAASRPRTQYIGTSLLVQRSGIGATPTDGLQLINLTAAAAGAQQYSSALRFSGKGWDSTAGSSKAVDFRMYVQPVQFPADPIANLLIDFSTNGGAFSNKLLLSSAGAMTLASSLTLTSGNLVMSVSAALQFGGRGFMLWNADGVFQFVNSSLTDFNRLQFGGTTASFPALGRNGIGLDLFGANGTGPSFLAIYNTKTSATNFERITLDWASNVARIWTEKGSGGGTARDMVLGADATEVLRFTSTGGTYATAKTLGFRSGTNQRAGNAVLVAGTVTVANTTVTANTLVMLTRKTSGGTLGTAITYTVTAATSFTINSDSALDTSTFSYVLIEVP